MTSFVWSYDPKRTDPPARLGKWIVEAPADEFVRKFEDIDRRVESGDFYRVRYTHRKAFLSECRARPFLAAFCDESRKDDARRALVELGFTPTEWRGSGTQAGYFEREEELGRDLDRFQVFEQKAKDPEFEQKART
jgi:hypothetical protein